MAQEKYKCAYHWDEIFAIFCEFILLDLQSSPRCKCLEGEPANGIVLDDMRGISSQVSSILQDPISRRSALSCTGNDAQVLIDLLHTVSLPLDKLEWSHLIAIVVIRLLSIGRREEMAFLQSIAKDVQSIGVVPDLSCFAQRRPTWEASSGRGWVCWCLEVRNRRTHRGHQGGKNICPVTHWTSC